MIPNMISDLMQVEEGCHGGEQFVNVFRAFDRSKGEQRVDFIDFVYVPAGATIGRHKHGDNYEWYVIVGGAGRMWFKGEEVIVKSWDVLVNPPYGEHALQNDSGAGIYLVVFQVSGGDRDE